MRHFHRLKIVHQAVVMLVLIITAVISAFLFWAADNARQAELAQSRTVADMADSLRTLVAEHASFYVRRDATQDLSNVGRYLGEYAGVVPAEGASEPQYVFHQKNPFLVLAEFSDAVQQSPSAAKFRITSDNLMNAANQPDLFDLQAMAVMRESGATEYWQIKEGRLRYARALHANKTCLACHGQPEQAPEVVRMKYRPPIGVAKGGGYGYEVGSVVGVTSVSVPHTSFGAMLRSQSFGFWASACTVLGLAGLVFWQLMRGLVVPLSRLSRYADDVAHSEDLSQVRQPRFDADEASSQNEIHQQSFALKALHESIRSAVDHITRHR